MLKTSSSEESVSQPHPFHPKDSVL